MKTIIIWILTLLILSCTFNNTNKTGKETSHDTLKMENALNSNNEIAELLDQSDPEFMQEEESYPFYDRFYLLIKSFHMSRPYTDENGMYVIHRVVLSSVENAGYIHIETIYIPDEESGIGRPVVLLDRIRLDEDLFQPSGLNHSVRFEEWLSPTEFVLSVSVNVSFSEIRIKLRKYKVDIKSMQVIHLGDEDEILPQDSLIRGSMPDSITKDDEESSLKDSLNPEAMTDSISM